jgi:predicted nucleotidyltransferase
MAKSNEKLRQITELLKREYNPSKLFLFGSQASKTAGTESDFDFVMVLPRYTGDRMKTWEECRELIQQNCGALADVFTYSECEFNQSIKEFSSIPETALNTGKEIDLGTA